MSRTSPQAANGPDAALPPYRIASKQPLQILAFLLPLIIAYEAGLALLLRSDEGVLTNKAHETILQFFDVFGLTASGGLYLGGAAIVVVLLVWHILSRDPWRIDPPTTGLMAAEALALTIPLIVLGLLLGDDPNPAASWSTGDPAAPPPDLATLGIWSRLAISIGAGLYEELLFRMMLIAVVHTLLVDVGKLNSALGSLIAIVISAIAFTWYHPLARTDGLPGISPHKVVFYFGAGLYFGCLFVLRGFGIVVGVHAFYDIVVVSSFGDS